MKKILFVTYNNPEKCDNGDKKYSWDILKALKKDANVNVHVLAYYDKKNESDITYYSLEELCDKVTYVPFEYKNILRIGLSIYPAMIANRKTKKMIHAVQKELDNVDYDAILVNMFRMAYLIEYIKKYPLKKIFISHNVEFLLSKSTSYYSDNLLTKAAYFLDYLKTKYWEIRFLSQYDSVSAICDADLETFKSRLKLKNLFLLTPITEIKEKFPKKKKKNILIVCGAFIWTPKIINLRRLFAAKNIEEIANNGYELHIVGKANPREINIGNKIKGIEVTGAVASVEPYYFKSSVALIPELAGGGFKLKIAEAVSYHLPIVALKGSVTDYEMVPDKHYIEACDFEHLISKGIELMKDPQKCQYLANNAIQLFEHKYSIECVNRYLMDNIFNNSKNKLP